MHQQGAYVVSSMDESYIAQLLMETLRYHAIFMEGGVSINLLGFLFFAKEKAIARRDTIARMSIIVGNTDRVH